MRSHSRPHSRPRSATRPHRTLKIQKFVRPDSIVAHFCSIATRGRLLQQNRPKADSCTAAKRDAVRKIKTIIWKAPETEDFNSLVVQCSAESLPRLLRTAIAWAPVGPTTAGQAAGPRASCAPPRPASAAPPATASAAPQTFWGQSADRHKPWRSPGAGRRD